MNEYIPLNIIINTQQSPPYYLFLRLWLRPFYYIGKLFIRKQCVIATEQFSRRK